MTTYTNDSHSSSSSDAHREEAMLRLDAMLDRESSAPMRSSNYFRRSRSDGEEIDEACRTAMAGWVQQVQRTLSLNPETVWIAMSFFDRYLATGKGRSKEVLGSKCQFQLACITAYYTAVKMHEPVVLGVDMLTQICRGTYGESDIVDMESDILRALEWRVSGHTPMDFVRTLLELLPEGQMSSTATESILEDCQEHLDRAVSDLSSTSSKPSVVGASCLASSLAKNRLLTASQKRATWIALNKYCDLSSAEVVAVTSRLFSDAKPCRGSGSSDAIAARKLRQQQQAGSYGGNVRTSPVCVSARQA
ncbi:hypothetical protein ACHAWF_011242 [Thalassiosira exigua]